MPLYEIGKLQRVPTPAPLLTLDTNCLIGLAKNEPDAAHIKRLVLLHMAGEARLRLVAVSASERGPDGQPLASYEHFRRFVGSLGLGDIPILLPLAIYGVAYWGHGLYADDEGTMAELLDRIWMILFGSAPRMLTSETPDRNKLCDALMMWSHIYHGGQVFVTSDHHFHADTKKPQLLKIGAGQILTPADAASTL